MGILSDFLVAAPSEADTIDAATDRSRWHVYQSKGFTGLELAQIHFMLRGLDPDAEVVPRRTVMNRFTKGEQAITELDDYFGRFELVHQTEGTWIRRVPDDLVTDLAELVDEDAVAEAWAECEELDGAEPADLVEVRRSPRHRAAARCTRPPPRAA